ncbi:MAG: transglutaminase domain-containing protein [Lachnospiraceae bacterium]|nr:transglutaminase domain-containing protein [Lachnospiraceae bacterium]
MPDIHETIRKTIELTGPESIVRIDSFINAMEDLNPEISDDISFLRKICRNYSDEIGKLLYTAYENRTDGSSLYYDRLGEFLINECGYNESWRGRFLSCFSYVFTGSVKSVRLSETEGCTAGKTKSEQKDNDKATAGKDVHETPKRSFGQKNEKRERIKDDFFDRCCGNFGFNRLKTAQNGKNLITYYNTVMRTLKKYYTNEDDIDDFEINANGKTFWYKDYFDCRRYSVSYEEAKKATIAAFHDCPLAYFAYTYEVFGNPEKQLSLVAVDDAFRLGSTRKRYRKLIEKEISEIVRSLPKGADDEKTAQYIYDEMCSGFLHDNIPVDNACLTNVYAHSVASFAEKRFSVWEGFAKTFQAVMLYLGYECLTVSGYVSKDGSNADKVREEWNLNAWNMLKIGEKWHIVDTSNLFNGNNNVFCGNPGLYNEFRDKDRIYDYYKYEFKHPAADFR